MLRPLFSGMKFAHAVALDDADSGSSEPDGSDDIMQSLVVDTFAGAMARAGGLGLARELERSLERKAP